MASANSSEALGKKYNWDDLEVGDINANDSELFFKRNHAKHELLGLTANRKEPVNLYNETRRVDDVAMPRNVLQNANQCKSVPRVYSYKLIYEQKLQLAMHKRDEMERKMREFHSRPMPNFEVQHRRMTNRQQSTRPITIPKTPNTLKNSRAREAKRKQKLAEMQQRTKASEMPANRKAVQTDMPEDNGQYTEICEDNAKEVVLGESEQQAEPGQNDEQSPIHLPRAVSMLKVSDRMSSLRLFTLEDNNMCASLQDLSSHNPFFGRYE